MEQNANSSGRGGDVFALFKQVWALVEGNAYEKAAAFREVSLKGGMVQQQL